jgi:CRP/FNR family cyclic AMP-dependent transcriptional regulator
MDAARLAEIPVFADLTLDQREHLARVCQEIEVEAGATLLREGDFGFAMFAVCAGTAGVVKDDEVIRTLGAGDVFGEIAVLSGGRRTATVIARSPMTLVTLLNRDLWSLERDVPAIGDALRTKIAEHMQPA